MPHTVLCCAKVSECVCMGGKKQEVGTAKMKLEKGKEWKKAKRGAKKERKEEGTHTHIHTYIHTHTHTHTHTFRLVGLAWTAD